MRLKSLQIKGFKSFADKTVVNFDENITGIVGPNGCGKSNIVDSIRWVIGEQKISHLRSENLDSLVFNGSKTRAASGLAEVSLTFENNKNLLPTEFSTVTITRRFFKNGESEYRLNDVSCRLKDIQNLFMDTGISTDSYAIIELGMVDDLIKDKENSRRRMLEQAAGISIYKTRKKEARQKLDATEGDLARLDDLLFEINNQLKTLENQARKAERWQEVRKEYREVSVELAKAALQGFNLTYTSLTESIETESNRKSELEKKATEGEAALEGLRTKLAAQETGLQQQQAEVNALIQNVRTLESDKALSAQRLAHLEEKATSVKGFLSKADESRERIRESIGYTQKSLEEETAMHAEAKTETEAARTEADARRTEWESLSTTLDTLRNQWSAAERKGFEGEKKLAVLDATRNGLQRSIRQLTDEQEARKQRMAEGEQGVARKAEEIEAKKAHLQHLQGLHTAARDALTGAQKEQEELRQMLNDRNRMLDARRNEHDLLKSLIDSMEGYPESVKFLHKNRGWSHGSPILSDILYVDEAYRTAVENLLEPYLAYYVVANAAEGMEAVALLDANKKGKASFFLLDGVRPQEAENQSIPEGATRASDVVEVDAKYKALVDRLLSGVYIAESSDATAPLQDGVLIDKQGKFIRGAYTLSGGSVGLFEGKKIGRAKNLEKLATQVEAHAAEVAELKEALRKAGEAIVRHTAALQDGPIRETERLISNLNNEWFGLRNRLEGNQQNAASAATRLAELQKGEEDARLQLETARAELGGLAQGTAEVKAELDKTSTEYRNREGVYNSASARYNALNLALIRQQSKIASLQQELTYKKSQLDELERQIQSNQRSDEELRQSTETLRTALQSGEDALAELKSQRDERQASLTGLEKAYAEQRRALTEAENNFRALGKEKEAADFLLASLKDRIGEIKLSLAGMKERLQVEFRIVLEDVLGEDRSSDRPVAELQEHADKLKKRLDNLGEVNPTAIEAYDEMKKRYEFILEQKGDLTTAKESLMQTIAEVESSANQKFLDTFHRVRDNFRQVFKTLFTEDDECDLVLENPDNLAETGIDIMAKPKGKRPSSINQLSGGERTLTATAMLFAIYLIKPAPFCILDEVDAPLDDANVGKFTNMIREFSANSQFIIVTHNKTTMSTVDVIYGVTMQEPGVSKLVPVDFRSLAN